MSNNLSELMLETNLSQRPGIELLKKLGYKYLTQEECNVERGSKSNCLLINILRKQLKQNNGYKYGASVYKFSDDAIEKAIDDLMNVTLNEGLVKASEKSYAMLMRGNSYPQNVDNQIKSFDIKYIDWENTKNNVFHISEEFCVSGFDNLARVDTVLFVNGIPLSVIEFKSGVVSINQGIEQILRNQRSNWIPQLFKYTSLLVVSNKNEVKYGTTKTDLQHYSTWRYDKDEKELIETKTAQILVGSNRKPTVQDYSFVALLSPERLIEITKYFIVFDHNVKKVCYYQQYYCVKNIISTIKQNDENGNRLGGLIWHTQGSGKSIIMAMTAKYISSEIPNSKVVIVTDRKELDQQIERTFKNLKISPTRAATGKHLIELIQSGKIDVITTVINKFVAAYKQGLKVESKNVFLIVDESHRTNYGELSTQMRSVFPNGCYLGFTGTPLMKDEKSKRKFDNNYIHKYTIKDGVADKTIVPLIYEGRFVSQNVRADEIDEWFNKMSERLSEKQKTDLKEKWSSISKLNSATPRIRKIAFNIGTHFTREIKVSGFKALLATSSKLSAVRYYSLLKTLHKDLTIEACISGPDTRSDEYDEDTMQPEDVNNGEVKRFWHEMMDRFNNKPDDYERTLRDQFVSGEIDILIVVDKLLTGFDVPICQVLYIDKPLRDHGLLQAIARTNRLKENKDYGLIIDYCGLLPNLNDAIDTYENKGLDNYSPDDVNGVVIDAADLVVQLQKSFLDLENIFSMLSNKMDEEEYEQFLKDNDEQRQKFYINLTEFIKKFNFVKGSERAYNKISINEIQNYKDHLVFYIKLRTMIQIRVGEKVDISEYQHEIQNLLDNYLVVDGLEILIPNLNILDKNQIQKEINLLSRDYARAEAIIANLTSYIKDKHDQNPVLYNKFSELIKKTLEEYKNKVINNSEFLQKAQKLSDDCYGLYKNKNYPKELRNEIAKVFYDQFFNLFGKTYTSELLAEISQKISDIFKEKQKPDWQNNISVQKKIRQAVNDLFDYYEDNKLFKITTDAQDEIFEQLLKIAIKREE